MASKKSGQGARSKEISSKSSNSSKNSRPDSGLPDSDSSSDDYDTSPGPKVVSKSKSKSKPSKNTSGSDDFVQVGIDLTNPTDLITKMDMLDLTEQETEDLLKQAYSINRQLKSELRGSDDPSLRKYAVSAPRKSGRGERLPPISSGGARHYTSDPHSQSIHTRGKKSKTSAASKRSAKTPKRRPDWVD